MTQRTAWLKDENHFCNASAAEREAMIELNRKRQYDIWKFLRFASKKRARIQEAIRNEQTKATETEGEYNRAKNIASQLQTVLDGLQESIEKAVKKRVKLWDRGSWWGDLHKELLQKEAQKRSDPGGQNAAIELIAHRLKTLRHENRRLTFEVQVQARMISDLVDKVKAEQRFNAGIDVDVTDL